MPSLIPLLLCSLAHATPVAVTIDDLPFVGPTKTGDSVPAALDRIINTLRTRKVPATGFFTCKRLPQDKGALTRWRRAGLEVANHSWSHRSRNDLSLEEWVADTKRCRDALTHKGKAPRYYRFPYLQTGLSGSERDESLIELRKMGHVRAPVTVDVADWVLAEPYAKGETEAASAYIDHVERSFLHARDVARRRAGRDVAQVLLLHANALAADHLGALLDRLHARGARFVTLEAALRDPIYDAPDTWADPVGASWLYRIRGAVPAEWAWDQAQQHALEDRFQVKVRATQRAGRDLKAHRVEGVPAWVIEHEQPISSNALVYQTPGGQPVLVDTPWTPSATQDLLDWIAARFGQKPALAAIGHFHLDAAGGTAALRAAEIPVYATERTAELLATRAPAMQRSLAKEHGAAFSGWRIGRPSHTFADRSTHTIGGARVELIYPGGAHAPDNLVAWFPDTGVLFGGCMVKGGKDLGYLGDADLVAYPGTIKALQALKPKVVIPGHGRRTDPAQLANTLQLLAADREALGFEPPTR